MILNCFKILRSKRLVIGLVVFSGFLLAAFMAEAKEKGLPTRHTIEPCANWVAKVRGPTGDGVWEELARKLAENIDWSLNHKNLAYDPQHLLQNHSTSLGEFLASMTASQIRFLHRIGFRWELDSEKKHLEIWVPSYAEIGERLEKLRKERGISDEFWPHPVFEFRGPGPNQKTFVPLGAEIPEGLRPAVESLHSADVFYAVLARSQFSMASPVPKDLSTEPKNILLSRSTRKLPIEGRRLSAAEHDLAHLFSLIDQNSGFGSELQRASELMMKLKSLIQQLKPNKSVNNDDFAILGLSQGYLELHFRLFFAIETLVLTRPDADLSFIGLPTEVLDSNSRPRVRKIKDHLKTLSEDRKDQIRREIFEALPKITLDVGGTVFDRRYLVDRSLKAAALYESFVTSMVRWLDLGLMDLLVLVGEPRIDQNAMRIIPAEARVRLEDIRDLRLAQLIAGLYAFRTISAEQWLKDTVREPLEKEIARVKELLRLQQPEEFSWHLPAVDRASPSGQFLAETDFWINPELLWTIYRIEPPRWLR